MKRISILILLALSGSCWSWSLFGPSTREDCLKEIPKVRLPDAKRLLLTACNVGFGERKDIKPEWVSAGKCIAKNADEFYSFDSSLKIINKCSDDPGTYEVYRRQLYMAQDDRREEAVNAAREARAAAEAAQVERLNRNRYEQDGSFTIYDSQSGRIKYCNRIGTLVSCY